MTLKKLFPPLTSVVFSNRRAEWWVKILRRGEAGVWVLSSKEDLSELLSHCSLMLSHHMSSLD